MRVGGGGGGGGRQRPGRASGVHNLSQRMERGGLPQDHVCPLLCQLVLGGGHGGRHSLEAGVLLFGDGGEKGGCREKVVSGTWGASSMRFSMRL